GCPSSSWHLRRPHHQGCEACRIACCAIEQVRTRHQRANGILTRFRRAYPPPTDRRRGDRVRRRDFITLLGARASLALNARAARVQQQGGKVGGIGFVGLTPRADRPTLHDAIRQGVRELGWVEGQNIVIDYRYAEGRVDRLRDLAAELVRLNLDLIVSDGTQG